MKKKKDAYSRLIELSIVVMISTMVGMFSGGAAIFTMMETNKDKSDTCKSNINTDLSGLSTIYDQIVNKYYVDINKNTLVEGAINGMLSTLNDPNSSYLDPSTTSSFDDRMRGEYEGVGIEMVTDDKGNTLIVTVFDNSPAEKAGVKVGDYITAVNGVNITGKTSDDISTMIRSENSDTVELQLTRDGAPYKATLKKETVVIQSVTSRVIIKNNKKIGYIKISIFAGNTYSQFKTALEGLEKQNIKSLVIDVRNNTGGYLTAVTSMLEMILPKGTVLYKLQSKDSTINKVDETDESRSYPIAVLINEYSASASEILSSSLNENINAPLIGSKSYGKGTVQQTMDIEGGGMAKITTEKWLTPKGNWVNGTGLKPTTFVVMSENYVYDQTDANDTQLQEALTEMAK